MARARRRQRKKQPKAGRAPRGKSEYYTPAELFMAALGLVILIVAIGVAVTAVLD